MQKNPYTFIIIGRSGSGKGTQLKMLKGYLEKNTPNVSVQSYICGDAFRAFDTQNSFISNLTRDLRNQGNYLPDFIATTLLFRDQIFNTINTTDHLFFDGYPRSVRQLEDCSSLLTYVGRKAPIFLDIVVSKEEVSKRMLLRKRADDSIEGIEKRQQEFDRTIVPMIEAIKKDNDILYIAVDGMGTPEEVHQNVLKALAPVFNYE